MLLAGERYKKLPSVCSFNDNKIRCYPTSKSDKFDDHQTSIQFTNTNSLGIQDNIACIYGDEWWIGTVKDKNEENNDVLVHFFHPSGPQSSFKLSKSDIVWVPIRNVLRKIIPLELTTMSGRTYNISEKLCNEISSIFNILRKY